MNLTSIQDVKKSEHTQINDLSHIQLHGSTRGYSRGLSTLTRCQGQHNLLNSTFSIHENATHLNTISTSKPFSPDTRYSVELLHLLVLCFIYARLCLPALNIFTNKIVPREILSTVVVVFLYQ